MAVASASTSRGVSVSNIVRIQQTLTAKNDELTKVKEELTKLNSKKRQLEKDVKGLKEELAFLKEGNSSLTEFDRDDYPWCKEMMLQLKSVFKIDAFRSHQKAAINATMSKLDCILIMPTGGGKSLCFQLPAILSNGVTLVISPLLSLMEDQLTGLKSLNISAGLLNSQTDKFESKRIFEAMVDPKATLKLLYVTPERLAKSKRFMSQLEKMYRLGRLARLVIDECHCCSSWGHDFRPDYKFLGILRRQFQGTPIIGLTATATSKVTLDIQKMLSIEGCLVFKDSFFRPNLKYEVYDSSASKDRAEEVAELIKTRFPHQSGIIYCLTISEVDNLTSKLKALNIRCDRYHAQLEPKDRTEIQHSWYTNKIQLIVATVAFGMGINKLDVRFVIHYSISKSLENFYQESGRCGRDGKTAYCILFYQLNDACRATAMMMTEKNGVSNVYNLLAYCLDRETCRKALIAQHFGDIWEGDACKGMCDNCEARIGTSTMKLRMIDATPLLLDILKILENANNIEQRVTVIKLMSAWFRKGEKKLRLDEVKVPSFSSSVCEWIVGRLLIDHYIEEEFHFTPYSTFSHFVPGSRKHPKGQVLNYMLPTLPSTFSTKRVSLPIKQPRKSSSTSKVPEKRKSKPLKPISDDSDIDDFYTHSLPNPEKSMSIEATNYSPVSSARGSQNESIPTPKKFTFKKKKAPTHPLPLKKQRLNSDYSDDDIVILD